MPEFTYAVTQKVHYYRGVDLDQPDDIVDLFENGEWDDTKNEVKDERIQVYDLDGKLVYDTGGPEQVTVWTLTVDGLANSVHVMAFASEAECFDGLRERYLFDLIDSETEEPLTEEEFEAYAKAKVAAMSNQEVLDYLTDDPGGYSIYIDSHVVKLP